MNATSLRLAAAAAALFACAHLPSQDLLGVTWNGAVVRIDSLTATVTPLGTGLQGQNCLARAADGTFWSTRRVSTTSHWYTRIDPSTGTATLLHPGVDLRGLATGQGNTLYGIRDGMNADQLVRIDTSNGVTTTIGNTGSVNIQGLAMHQGVLYAWDVFDGLLVVDPLTGATVDPFPGVGGPAYQQSLCSHPDGRLLLGGGDSNGPDQLWVVDLTNGGTSLVGNMVGAVDLRGLEPLSSRANSFGLGCNGASGPVHLSVTGQFQAGGTLLTASSGHAPNTLGVVVFGLSTSIHQSYALPLLLDPLFGTNQCSLRVSIDANVIVVTGPGTPAPLHHAFVLPPGASGAVFHVQHACFEPVAGGMSWSNGVTVNVQ